MKSIIQTTKECYVCKTIFDLHEHHIFEGIANRKLSEKYGLKVWLCSRHHNMSNEGVHFNKALENELKILGQRKFEETYEENFLKVFGRNYIW